jgi:hypothetical protein
MIRHAGIVSCGREVWRRTLIVITNTKEGRYTMNHPDKYSPGSTLEIACSVLIRNPTKELVTEHIRDLSEMLLNISCVTASLTYTISSLAFMKDFDREIPVRVWLFQQKSLSEKCIIEVEVAPMNHHLGDIVDADTHRTDSDMFARGQYYRKAI